jgi:hypothetical protein
VRYEYRCSVQRLSATPLKWTFSLLYEAKIPKVYNIQCPLPWPDRRIDFWLKGGEGGLSWTSFESEYRGEYEAIIENLLVTCTYHGFDYKMLIKNIDPRKPRYCPFNAPSPSSCWYSGRATAVGGGGGLWPLWLTIPLHPRVEISGRQSRWRWPDETRGKKIC